MICDKGGGVRLCEIEYRVFLRYLLWFGLKYLDQFFFIFIEGFIVLIFFYN